MRMKSGLLLVILFLGQRYRADAAQEHEPEAPLRYRLIQVVEASTLQEKIDEAASEGYRLVGVTPASAGTTVAVLERSGSPADVYAYVMLAGKGDPVFQEKLNEAGARGFRLLSRDVALDWRLHVPMQLRLAIAWMEKPPGPTQKFEYAVVPFGVKMATKASLNPKLWADLNPLDYVKPEIKSAEDRGFHLVRIVSGVALIMEKAVTSGSENPSPSRSSAAPGQPEAYRSLTSLRGSKLQRKLLEAAADGYCVVDIDSEAPPIWPAILLDKNQTRSANGAAEHCGYEVIQKRDLGEADFNQAGARGFRLVPQSLNYYGSFQTAQNGRPEVNAIVEKVPAADLVYQYRSVSTPQLTELSEKLEHSGAEGYRVIKVDTVKDGTALVIMQKSEERTGK
jgi:hypothetical protein